MIRAAEEAVKRQKRAKEWDSAAVFRSEPVRLNLSYSQTDSDDEEVKKTRVGQSFRVYWKPLCHDSVAQRHFKRLASNVLNKALSGMWKVVDKNEQARIREMYREEDERIRKRIEDAKRRAGLCFVGFGVHAKKTMRWVRENAKEWTKRHAEKSDSEEEKHFCTFMSLDVEDTNDALKNVSRLVAMLRDQQESRVPWWNRKRNDNDDDDYDVKKQVKSTQQMTSTTKITQDEVHSFCRTLSEEFFAEAIYRFDQYVAAQHNSVRDLTISIVNRALEKIKAIETQKHKAEEERTLRRGWFQGTVLKYDLNTKRHLLEVQMENDKQQRRRLVWKSLDETYEWQDVNRCVPRIEIRRTWICRYGWDIIFDENLNAYYYWNARTGESTYDHPDYTYDELEACMRIQRRYRGYAGRRAFQMAVRNSGACQTLRNAVREASVRAWIGYGMEGVNVKMWLCRIGLPHLTTCLNPKSNIRKRLKLQKLHVTLSELKRMSISDLNLLGITDQADLNRIQSITSSRDAESRAMALVCCVGALCCLSLSLSLTHPPTHPHTHTHTHTTLEPRRCIPRQSP